ncbi:MAG TPA: RNA ligase family protein [Rhodothermales bacterium]|nr:RNA ligase family protein [Rhodothermales bacterium]
MKAPTQEEILRLLQPNCHLEPELRPTISQPFNLRPEARSGASPEQGRRPQVNDTLRATDASTSWHSYPKIYNLGHAALAELLADPVLVEEKVDGSQFSFGVIHGVLRCRSRGQELIVAAPEKMFERAVTTAMILAPRLRPGWTYRGEYLQKPKHNALAYDRVPAQHVILFDINPAQETYLSYAGKAAEAARLGLEVVPALHDGPVASADELRALIDRVSCLGGAKVEGIVVKNYRRFGPDKKVLMGKHVGEDFKEVHKAEWSKANPTRGDVLEELIRIHRTPARWHKAIQHLAERGELETSPRDIGKLIPEVKADIEAECVDAIKEALWRWAKPHILRGATAGLPDWYKQRLIDKQFGAPITDGPNMGPEQNTSATGATPERKETCK